MPILPGELKESYKSKFNMKHSNKHQHRITNSNTKPQVIRTKWGVACRIGDKVYINSSIKKNSKLYGKLLSHELKHTSGYTAKDILLDLKGEELDDVKKDYYKFIFKNPRSWVMFLPVWKYGKEITIDPIMSAAWLIYLMITLRIILI